MFPRLATATSLQDNEQTTIYSYDTELFIFCKCQLKWSDNTNTLYSEIEPFLEWTIKLG